MSGPVRWLEGGDASELERSILSEARSAEPPPQVEEQVWAVLGARLALGVGAGAAGGAAVAGGASAAAGGGGVASGTAATGGASAVAGVKLGTAATALVAIKWGAVGLLAGLAVAGTATVLTPAPKPRASFAAPAVVPLSRKVTAAPAAPSPARPVATDVPAPKRAARAPSVAASAEPAAISSEVVSSLSEQSRALEAARQALKRGDTTTALAILEGTRARYPNSVLGQELDVLTIEALAQSGRTDAAREQARAFLAAFPNSPHLASVRRYAKP